MTLDYKGLKDLYVKELREKGLNVVGSQVKKYAHYCYFTFFLKGDYEKTQILEIANLVNLQYNRAENSRFYKHKANWILTGSR